MRAASASASDIELDAGAAAGPFLKVRASRSAVPTPLSRFCPGLTFACSGASKASDLSFSLLQAQVSPRPMVTPSG